MDSLDLFTAECIEILEQDGAEAFEALLSTQPEAAQKVRRQVASLSRLGLLALPGSDWTETIGPYRVVQRLGSGGMGEVLLAEHVDTGQRVAIKLGPIPQGALSPEHERHTRRAVERFAREVRAVAHLTHPSVVPIIEVGEHKGRAWFAMEHIDGVGLDRVLEAVRSSGVAPESLTGADLAAAVPGATGDTFPDTWVGAIGGIVQQVAEALVEAHGSGVVHRDIKPSNLLLSADGSVHIVDFGLAHLENMPTLTLSGEFAGTPFYVAPEQIEGTRGDIDGRADQFSLGVTLYECTSLQRPFVGHTPVEVLTLIATRDPEPLRRVAPHVPVDLERLCTKSLEKNPDHRYCDIGAFADDLERFLQHRPLLAKLPTRLQMAKRWARRRPWRAASALLATTLVLGAPIGLLVANSRIRAERDRVQAEARRNGLVVEHFVQHFERSPGLESMDDAARALLDRGVKRLQHGFSDEPSVRASLLQASGRAYLELGRPSDARPLLDRALGLWEREGESAKDDRARVLSDLARTHLADDRPGIAGDLAQRALVEMSPDALTPEFEQRARATMASAHLALGEVQKARASLGSLGLSDVDDAVRAEVASSWEAIGDSLMRAGDAAGASAALQSSLDLLARAWTPDGARLAVVHDRLADAAEALGSGDSVEAREHRARAARLRALDGDSPDSTGSVKFPFMEEPAWAAEYGEAFDGGVASLQAGRLAEARACFLRAYEVRPSMSATAYNLACVESREGRLEESAAWLDTARRAGFNSTEAHNRSLAQDVELEAVRGASVGRAAIHRLEEQLASARTYPEWSVWQVPVSEGKDLAPLLVVIHEDGESPRDVAAGGWADFAASVGAHLLIPCAPYLVGETVQGGTAWSSDPRDLWEQPGAFGQPVLDQVRAALREPTVDLDRVWIAGRGVGAMLALDLLVENPGLFRAGWLVNPCLHPSSGAGSGRLARALGARLMVTFRGNERPPEALADDAEVHSKNVEGWLRAEGGWREALRVRAWSSGDQAVAKDGDLGWWTSQI